MLDNDPSDLPDVDQIFKYQQWKELCTGAEDKPKLFRRYFILYFHRT